MFFKYATTLLLSWSIAQVSCWATMDSNFSRSTIAMAVPGEIDIPFAKETVQRLCAFEQSKIRELTNCIASILKGTERLPVKLEVRSFTLSEISIAMAEAERKGYIVQLTYDDDGRCTDMSLAVESQPQNEWHDVSAKLASH